MSRPFSMWAFLRSVLTQGAAIQQDYDAGRYGSYEEYSARVDAAARERKAQFDAETATPQAAEGEGS